MAIQIMGHNFLPVYMFKQFSEKYKFAHVTSSPGYPASNPEAERAMRTAAVKTMLSKCDDPYLAMLILQKYSQAKWI